MGCACDSFECNVGCFECDCQRGCKETYLDSPVELAACLLGCGACSVVPNSPLMANVTASIGIGTSYPMAFIGSCSAASSYDTCTSNCSSVMFDAIEDCEDTYESCESACIGSCGGDPGCEDTCIGGCLTDFYECQRDAQLAAIACEEPCWNDNEAGLMECAAQTDSVESCCQDAEDLDSFSACLITSDAAYVADIWPGLESFRSLIRSASATFYGCLAACEGESACVTDCNQAGASGAHTARAALYSAEASAGEARAESREVCIRTEIERRSKCSGRYLAKLKFYDMNADRQMWGAAAAVETCISGCDDPEQGDGTPPSCTAGCNLGGIEAWYAIENQRVSNRLELCKDRWDASGQAIHQHLRSICLSTCTQGQAYRTAACGPFGGCDACCGDPGCLGDCPTCSSSPNCVPALETCLNGCAGDPECFQGCIDDYETCAEDYENAGLGNCAEACDVIAPDCAECDEVAAVRSDLLLCLPFEMFWDIPPSAGSVICD